jgi:hypothetical protein
VGWEFIQALFSRPAPRDTLVTRQGALYPELDPGTYGEVRRLFETGHCLTFRGVERQHRVLKSLAEDFADTLNGPVSFRIHLTPKGAHTFGWHRDEVDEFILLTRGSQELFYRRTTSEAGGFEDQGSPILGGTLEPGRWLYLPAGWWHAAWATADSFTLVLSVDRESAVISRDRSALRPLALVPA